MSHVIPIEMPATTHDNKAGECIRIQWVSSDTDYTQARNQSLSAIADIPVQCTEIYPNIKSHRISQLVKHLMQDEFTK